MLIQRFGDLAVRVAARAAAGVTDALFQVAGTRSALDSLNLRRHWRDARTRTLRPRPAARSSTPADTY